MVQVSTRRRSRCHRTAVSEPDIRLAKFITENIEQILVEWEAFAASLLSPGHGMSSLALRDHATQILLAIAEDIESSQSDVEQSYKSKGFAPIAEATRTAAMTHGALRYLAGFDLRQLAFAGLEPLARSRRSSRMRKATPGSGAALAARSS